MMDTGESTTIVGGYSGEMLSCNRERNVGYKISRGLSLLLHPFVIPAYATIIMLFSSSIITIISLKLKLYFVALIALNTLCLPLFILLLLRYAGVLKNLDLSTRKERVVPILIVVSSYVLCASLMPISIVSFLINKFLFASIGCIVVAFVINFFWKISLHLIAMGGITSMLIYSFMYGYDISIWMLLLAIIFTGFLASARLYLGAHNMAQVSVGYFLGFLVSILIMLF